MFILLTDATDNTKILINVDKISDGTVDGAANYISLFNDYEWEVKETPEEIYNLIKNENKKDREIYRQTV